jgi:hypothetical protein
LIADALEEEGITHAQPKDYLHFFCLGKREPMTPVRLCMLSLVERCESMCG